jgi:hypothetical protein
VLSVYQQHVGACLVASGFLAGGCGLQVDGCKVIGGGFVENVTSHCYSHHFACFGGVFAHWRVRVPLAFNHWYDARMPRRMNLFVA